MEKETLFMIDLCYRVERSDGSPTDYSRCDERIDSVILIFYRNLDSKNIECLHKFLFGFIERVEWKFLSINNKSSN